jgi:hypothetical protein
MRGHKPAKPFIFVIPATAFLAAIAFGTVPMDADALPAYGASHDLESSDIGAVPLGATSSVPQDSDEAQDPDESTKVIGGEAAVDRNADADPAIMVEGATECFEWQNWRKWSWWDPFGYLRRHEQVHACPYGCLYDGTWERYGRRYWGGPEGHMHFEGGLAQEFHSACSPGGNT